MLPLVLGGDLRLAARNWGLRISCKLRHSAMDTCAKGRESVLKPSLQTQITTMILIDEPGFKRGKGRRTAAAGPQRGAQPDFLLP